MIINSYLFLVTWYWLLGAGCLVINSQCRKPKAAHRKPHTARRSLISPNLMNLYDKK